MPTYEYRCPKGHEFEQFQRMSDPPEALCPQCGEAASRMLSAGAGLIFKGSGFYLTDYRSESYKKQEAAEKRAPFENFDPRKSLGLDKKSSNGSSSDKSESKSQSKDSTGGKAAGS
ncbi:MAG TPA: zinc ribbon domain-containing protein [Longimicrobiales bacterium]|nr:zinc ribbon domain-containing protein [Longimicrobiales bacterium]